MTARLCLTAVLAVAACDAQVTSDYRGERLAEIRANVVAESAPPDADAALVWWTAGGVGSLTTPAATEGEFPSAFTLSVYRRPPEAALVDAPADGEEEGAPLVLPWLPKGTLACRIPAGSNLAPGGGRLAIASVAAVADGTGGVVGLADGFALVYVASDSALDPGYHLMRVTATDAAEGALACNVCADGDTGAGDGCDGPALSLDLEECEDGIGTEIEIRIRG